MPTWTRGAQALFGYSLDPLEAKVLRMRFGIGNDTRHTLEQIGNEVGLTRERIRQIEIKALGKLKFHSVWGASQGRVPLSQWR